MADDEDYGPEDPDELSNFLGGFNEATYYDDLENFPDHFDENGWPLFGIYDPYTLKHPITGVSWHIAPRVPTDYETDADYEDWFALAEMFSGSPPIEHLRAKPDVPEENPNTSDILYGSNSKNAATGNLAYLRKHVLPELKVMFERRTNSPRFMLVWVEYCRILEILGVAVPNMKHRKAGRDTDQSAQSKYAQVKWYLHWRRRHVDELGKSLIAVNAEFKNMVESIVKEETKCPDGFDIDWFRKTQLKFKKATNANPASSEWGLVRALKNSIHHPMKSKFLQQCSSDEPRIPSVDLDDFK